MSEVRLATAIARARPLIAKKQAAAENLARLLAIGSAPAGAPASLPRKVVGRIGEEYFLLSASDVLAFQADGEVVWIMTAKHRYLATQSRRKIEEKLSAGAFRRIHRNAPMNVERVRKMAVLSSIRWLVTLANSQGFVVSQRMARNVREILSW